MRPRLPRSASAARSNSVLTKHRTLLHFAYHADGVTHLYREDRGEHYILPTRDFDEMGCPTTITLTIEPGDLLNED